MHGLTSVAYSSRRLRRCADWRKARPQVCQLCFAEAQYVSGLVFCHRACTRKLTAHLDSKMRRPEDYVPVKPGASKPRKSSRPTSTVPRTSDLPPMSLESTPSTVPAPEPSPAPPAATPVPRPASLAGKKPPLSSSASADSSTFRDDWNEEQFLRQSAAKGRATGAPAASLGAGQGPPLSTSQAGQDLEARRRQRQAARDQLARLGGGSGGAGEGSGARPPVQV